MRPCKAARAEPCAAQPLGPDGVGQDQGTCALIGVQVGDDAIPTLSLA